MKRLIVTAAFFCLAYISIKAEGNIDIQELSIEFQKNLISAEGIENYTIKDLIDQEKKAVIREDFQNFINFFSKFQKKLLTYNGNIYDDAIHDFIDLDRVLEYKTQNGSVDNFNDEYNSIISLIQADYKAICNLTLKNEYNYNIRNLPKTWSLVYKPKVEKYNGPVYMLLYHSETNEETACIFSKIDNTWKIVDLYQQPSFYKVNNTNKPVRLNNIFFKFGKSELLPNSYPELNKLVKKLKENPSTELSLLGHTDNVGTDEFNMKLSKDRADAVKNYLISKGINKIRIKTKGFGSSKPVATNTTNEGRALNRRVEFQIIK